MIGRFLLAVTFVIAPSVAEGGKTTTKKVQDPITGGTCYVRAYASSGGYMLRWGAADHIFPPSASIWSCPSGYASLVSDFDNLSPNERRAIAEYLEDQPKLYATEAEREERRQRKLAELQGEEEPEWFDESSTNFSWNDYLEWSAEQEKWGEVHGTDAERAAFLATENEHLEGLYKLRNKDEAFWALFYRVLVSRVRWSDPLGADVWRAKALPLILWQLELDEASGYDLVGLRFVAGDYALSLDDHDLARRMFDAARGTVWTDDRGMRHVGHEIFNALIEAREPLLAREHP